MTGSHSSGQSGSGPSGMSDTLSVRPRHLFLLGAGVLFLVNLLPLFDIGFHQDDFRHFWILTTWDWDVTKALRQEGIEQGFRPLLYTFRLVRWNLFGESVVAHRTIQAAAHLLVGLTLARIAWLLGRDALYGAVAAFLFFASILTRATIYSFVALNLADLLILITYVLVLEGVARNWRAYRLGLATVAVALVALFTKENGVAAPAGAILLAFFFWKRLGTRTALVLSGAHALSLALYGAVYVQVAAQRYLGLEQAAFSLSQGIAVGKGAIFSLSGPVAAVYLSLRKYGYTVPATAAVTAVAALGIGWLLLRGHGGVPGVIRSVRRRFRTFLLLSLLILGNLAPYLMGRWFENRMLVPAFGLGIVLWSLVLADALRRWRRREARLSATAALAPVLLLGALSAGSPVEGVDGELEMAEAMRRTVRQAEADGYRTFCLVEFPSQGSDMRVGNAWGLVNYVTGGDVKVLVGEQAVERAGTDACVWLRYDEGVENPVPLAVKWPGAAVWTPPGLGRPDPDRSG